ncbi:MAG: aspartate-semialdehyde dehydrogenase [Erysipelotrichales bacterium]|nr:aspartate-semialdehyde dehydrogenase [Erysipelotrichales bacterium]
MNKKYRVAVIGGHGLVSKSIIEDLERFNFPMSELVVYGSKVHASIDLVVNYKKYRILPLEEDNVMPFDLVFFSSSDDLSNKYAKLFIEKGARVIDNSSFFRNDKSVPLVIPEINEEDLLNDSKIYANPNCTTIMMLLAIYPLHQEFKIEKLNISSYQSISGAGTLALEEYVNESIDQNYEAKILPSKNAVKKVIYNNLLPVVDDIKEDGYTGEEIKIIKESQKILHLKDLEVNPTCVRVPTLYGHGITIYALCKEKIDLEKVKEIYQSKPYLKYKDTPDYPDLKEVVGTPIVEVGRFRVDKYCEYTLDLFATSDNLIRGASYNAVQIGLSLIKLGIL